MTPSESADALESWHRDHPVGPDDLPGLLSMGLDFYRLVRCDDVLDQPEGDSLLFQYGTYDWGGRENFEVDLTRQFISRGINSEAADDAMSQLHLIVYFEPDAELKAMGSYEYWCSSLAELPKFQRTLLALPIFAALSAKTPRQMIVEWGKI